MTAQRVNVWDKIRLNCEFPIHHSPRAMLFDEEMLKDVRDHGQALLANLRTKGTWAIPSPQWREEVMLIRETFGLNMPHACDVLNYFGSADAAFEVLA